MNIKKSLTEIRKDLKSLDQYDLIIFGSYNTTDFTPRSDIDIAIITHETNPDKNQKIWFNLLGSVPQIYDIKVFELLPLEIKADIMDNYIVLFGNHLDISEYFYHFRKLWKDCKGRYYENQFTSIKEKLAVMEKVQIYL